MLIYFSGHLKTAFGRGGSVEQRLGQTLQYAAFHFGPNLLLPALHKSPRQICSCAREPETFPYSCAQHAVCFGSGQGRSCLFAFTSSRALNPRAKQKANTANRGKSKGTEADFPAHARPTAFILCLRGSQNPIAVSTPVRTASFPLGELHTNKTLALHWC